MRYHPASGERTAQDDDTPDAVAASGLAALATAPVLALSVGGFAIDQTAAVYAHMVAGPRSATQRPRSAAVRAYDGIPMNLR